MSSTASSSALPAEDVSSGSSALITETLLEMLEHLQAQNVEALQKSIQALNTSVKPDVLMQVLATYIFQPDPESTTSDTDDNPTPSNKAILSSSDALSLLGCFVHTDAARYLQPASRAVRDEAMKRCITSTEQLFVSPELLHVLVSQLSGSDIQASTHATETLVACCRQLGLSLGDSTLRAIAEAWRSAWNATDIHRTEASTIAVRCASAIVDLVCINGSMMQSAMECGDISLLLTMLTDESDPLMEVSTLDLIERMAVTQPMHHERAQWLFSNDVVIPLLQMCGGTEQGVPDAILGSPALRVVAALCRLAHRDSTLIGVSNGEITRGFHLALHNFQGSGEMDRLAIIDAISSFASASSDALEMVLSDPVTRKAWLSLSVAQPKLKSVVLFSVAMVLDPDDETDAKGDTIANPPPSNALGMKLFSQLGQVNNDEATNLILSIAKSPLPETRLASYSLLKAVVKLPTGGQLLFTHPDFFEFLLRRESERTKEGREAKYELVQAVLQSPVKGLLAEDIVKQLDKYVRQGAHYVETQRWELATE